MIQNVKTRWDNTFFMLQRAKFMKKTIHKWLAQTNFKLKILTLFKKKWNQVYYIIELLELFHNVTRVLDTTHDLIILEAWETYNSFHDHLKKTRSQIRQQFRESSWTVKLHEVILVDTKMLKKYYEATCDKKSTYFNVEALLNLMKKGNVYSVSCLNSYCCILSLSFLSFVHRHLLLSLLLLSTFYRCFLSLLSIVAFYRYFLSLLSIATFYCYQSWLTYTVAHVDIDGKEVESDEVSRVLQRSLFTLLAVELRVSSNSRIKQKTKFVLDRSINSQQDNQSTTIRCQQTIKCKLFFDERNEWSCSLTKAIDVAVRDWEFVNCLKRYDHTVLDVVSHDERHTNHFDFWRWCWETIFHDARCDDLSSQSSSRSHYREHHDTQAHRLTRRRFHQRCWYYIVCDC